MIISRITTQKKNVHRYNVFVTKNGQESYLFSVDEDILIKHNIHKGMELTDEQVALFEEEDTVQFGYIRAIQYLSYRLRSIQEVEEHLQKLEVDESHIPQIIERLLKQKYLDDTAFANMFVKHRIQTSNKGPQMVFQELKAKGVHDQIAAKAIEAYTFDVQEKRAMKVAQKRMNRKGKESLHKKRQQTEATLYRNGFAQDVIQYVLGEFSSEANPDEEWESIQHQGNKLFRRHAQKWEGFELEQKVKEGLYRQGFSFEYIGKFIEKRKTKVGDNYDTSF